MALEDPRACGASSPHFDRCPGLTRHSPANHRRDRFWPRDASAMVHNDAMEHEAPREQAMDLRPQFLFVGHSNTDGAVSKLKAYGIRYEQKLLESSPDNWRKISKLIRKPEIKGVIAKFTLPNLNRLADPRYEDESAEMLAALGSSRHLVLIFEGILRGESNTYDFLNPHSTLTYGLLPEEDRDGHDAQELLPSLEYKRFLSRPDAHYLTDLSEEKRTAIISKFEEAGVSIVPYRTNAQVSLLTTDFVDDTQHDLLFRVYVPRGRLYAAEAARMLDLFRDWLNRTGHARVRQSGYDTAAGSVYELFGYGDLVVTELSDKFLDFERFLDQCVNDPESARASLILKGVPLAPAEALVARHAKETRRITLDLAHQRERRVLELRQQYEVDLDEFLESTPYARQELQTIIESRVPSVSSPLRAALAIGDASSIPEQQITINQHIINAVDSNIVQNIAGIANLGSGAAAVIAVIQEFGGVYQSQLESAVYELEDPSAKAEHRVSAAQRIKGFLYKVAPSIGKAALEVGQKYVDSKLGL